MQRALVSGITGHVGAELSCQLLAAGVEVMGLSRQEGVDAGRARVARIDGGIASVVRAFEEFRPDTVFHLAGLSRREHRTDDVEPFVAANILFGTQLLEAMRLVRCSRIVVAGTHLQNYERDDRAYNFYASTRQAFEEVLSFFADGYGMGAVRLTLCTLYGEHDRTPKLLTDMVRAWTDRTPLSLWDPEGRLDMVHVEDAAAAFIQAANLLERQVIPNGVLSRFSVTSGKDVTAGELVALFERLAEWKFSIQGAAPGFVPKRIAPRRGPCVPDWQPRIRLEAGIARILRYYGQESRASVAGR